MKIKTQFRFFPEILTTILTGTILLSACSINVKVASLPNIETEEPTVLLDSALTVPVTEVPETHILTAQPPSNTGTTTTFGNLTLVVPPGIASGASGSEFPRVDDETAAWWQKTPGHLQVMLGDYYVLQEKSLQPLIYVFPAQDYAELVPAAFESLHRLNNILGNPGSSITPDQLPAVPFFNSQQVFAANIETISFQNGTGVRFLTQYDQYAAPVNNYELFYHFQGVTRDGAYYIIAIFPITAPVLAETSDPAANLPPEGIAYPDITDSDTDWQAYYTAISELLNNSPQDTFTPTINQLDLLINSMLVTP